MTFFKVGSMASILLREGEEEIPSMRNNFLTSLIFALAALIAYACGDLQEEKGGEIKGPPTPTKSSEAPAEETTLDRSRPEHPKAAHYLDSRSRPSEKK